MNELNNNTKLITVNRRSMNNTFRQSHGFIFESQDYSSTEEVIISLLCSRENVFNNTDEMPLEEVAKLKPNAYLFEREILEEAFNTDFKNLYSRLQDATRNLMQPISSTDAAGKTFEHENLFVRCSYNSNGLYLLPSQAFYDRLFLSKNGFAEIDYNAFISVKQNVHAMRLFRILSRFKGGDKRLFPLEIDYLKKLFRVFDEEGNVVKPSYVKTSTFLRHVIEPAIKCLNDSPVVSTRLKFFPDEQAGKSAQVGIRKIMQRGKITHIEFLYEWFLEENYLPSKFNYSKKEAYIRLQDLIKAKHSRELSLEELHEAKACLEIHEKYEHVEKFEEEIQMRQLQEAEKDKAKTEEDSFDFDFLS